MFESEHMRFQNYEQIPNSDLHPAVKKKMMPIPLFQKKSKRKKERNLVIL